MQTAGWQLEDRQRLVCSDRFFRRGASSGLFFALLSEPLVSTWAHNNSPDRNHVIAQATQTFTNGVAAYDRGEYAIAQEVWRLLTHSGDPAAQRNLPHLYRMGLGVAQDFVQAVSL